MANRKILYSDSTGIIRELPSGSGVTASYYDDAGNGVLFAKNITFNTMSFKNDGLLVVNNGTASVLTKSDGSTIKNYDVVSWDGVGGRWKYIVGSLIDVTGAIPGGGGQLYTASANADISGTFNEPKVRSLSNVITGVLSVQNGGTGLGFESGRNDFFGLTGEYILTASSTGKFGFLTASQATSAVALVSNGTSWEYITQSLNNSVEISVYNQAGVYYWQKPAGTKQIRVLIQGAGGGGGSGANRTNNTVSAIGGTGGGAGGFIESPLFAVEDNYTNIQIIIGSGGVGGNFPSIGSAGNTGSDGGSSSFDDFYAPGGLGGNGGSLSNTIDTGKIDSSSSYIAKTFLYSDSPQFYKNLYGSKASTTYGIDSEYNKIINQLSTRAGTGAGGGSLSASSNANSNGGNGSINPIILSSITQNSISNENSSFRLVTGAVALTFQKDSPFSDNEYSIQCAGAQNNLVKTSGSYGTYNSDYTIEGWFNISALAASTFSNLFSNDQTTAQTYGGRLSINLSNQFRYNHPNATVYTSSVSDVFVLNQWNHVALVRKDNIMSVFYNGRKITLKNASNDLAIATNTTDFIINEASSRYLVFGGVVSAGSVANVGFMTGKMSNLRFIDKALYLSDFTLPITKFNYSPSVINSGSTSQVNALNAYSASIKNNLSFNFASDTQINDLCLSSGGGGGASKVVDDGTGGTGGNGSWGSGGGGGGASQASSATGRQGGNGGDGYIAVISYKY